MNQYQDRLSTKTETNPPDLSPLTHACPPARTEYSTLQILKERISEQDKSLESVLRKGLSCRRIVTGSSWVILLKALLEELHVKYPSRSEVVLAGYACDEFVKAILAAGLLPHFVDVDSCGRMPVANTKRALSNQTLAVFSINNVGVESNNSMIADACADNGIVCIEDATYTYMGRSPLMNRNFSTPPFGSFGDISILNFSEGKLIPVGGGALALNNPVYKDAFDTVAQNVQKSRPASEFEELLRLIVYRIGSSQRGYRLYWAISDDLNVDLKRLLSMEPTRVREQTRELQGNSARDVRLSSKHMDELGNTPLRPLNTIKQLCGTQIVSRIDSMYADRWARYCRFRDEVDQIDGLQVLPLSEGTIPLRIPLVVDRPLSDSMSRSLSRYGLSSHYGTDFPMAGDPSLPNATDLYQRLYTVPCHDGVDDTALQKILHFISEG